MPRLAGSSAASVTVRRDSGYQRLRFSDVGRGAEGERIARDPLG